MSTVKCVGASGLKDSGERLPLGSGKELCRKHRAHEIRERESEYAHSPGGAVRTSGSQLLPVQAQGNPRKIVLKKRVVRGLEGKV